MPVKNLPISANPVLPRAPCNPGLGLVTWSHKCTITAFLKHDLKDTFLGILYFYPFCDKSNHMTMTQRWWTDWNVLLQYKKNVWKQHVKYAGKWVLKTRIGTCCFIKWIKWMNTKSQRNKGFSMGLFPVGNPCVCPATFENKHKWSFHHDSFDLWIIPYTIFKSNIF